MPKTSKISQLVKWMPNKVGVFAIMLCVYLLSCVKSKLQPSKCVEVAKPYTVWEFIILIYKVNKNLLKLLITRMVYGRRFTDRAFSFEIMQNIVSTSVAHYDGRMGPWMPLVRKISDFLLFEPYSKYFCFKNGLLMEKIRIDNVPCQWLRYKARCNTHTVSNDMKTTYYYLYIHGGGYAWMSPSSHVEFVTRLMKATKEHFRFEGGAEIESFFVDYRKAPEHAFPAAVDDAEVAFNYLTKHKNIPASKIIIAGDSAGGGLALSLLLRLRSKNMKMPQATILISPLVDLQSKLDIDVDHDLVFVTLIKELRLVYAPGVKEITSSMASPVHNVLNNLPPIILQVGEKETLYQQCLRFASRAQADGSNVVLDIHKNMPHIFSFFPESIIPASTLAIQKLGKFAAHHFANDSTYSSKDQHILSSGSYKRNSSSFELGEVNVFDHPKYLREENISVDLPSIRKSTSVATYLSTTSA